MNTKSKVPILLIEDNMGDVDLIRIYLNDVGFKHEFHHTDSLIDGIEMINSLDIELVLLDLSLPDSNGYKTLSRFLEKVPFVPVIVITGMNNEIIGNQAIKAGAQDFLIKGQFDGKIMGRSIRYSLQRFKTHSRLEEMAKELAVSENRYLEAQELAHFGNWEMDIVSFEMKWSDEIFRIFGFQPETLSPTLSDYIGYVHREDRESVERFFENSGKDGQMHRIEHRIIVGGKQIKHLAIQAKIYFDEYFEKALLVGALQDITERKLSEQLIFEKQISNQEAKIQEQVFEGMNFQIRTPLNSVINLLYLLENTNTSPQQADFVSKLKTSVDDLSIVLNNMMNFSVLSGGNLTKKIEEYVTNEFLNGLEKLVSIKAENAKVVVDFKIDQTVPNKIMADGGKISLVYFNLTDLLLRKMESGEKLSTSIKIDNSSKLLFNIQSTGNPFEFSEINEISTDIDQNNLTEEQQQMLNFNIVKKLVENLGGNIQFNEIETGNEINLELPIEISATPNLFELQKPVEQLRILMAEDHFLNQMSTKKVLLTWSDKVQVDIAENGKLAVEAFKKNIYDLVLMDIQMPEMNGIDATIKIRELSSVPIIALTANASKQEADKCIAAGMNNYLSKPFKPQDLYQKIMECLSPVKA